MTRTDALVHGVTVEGYRIAAVDSSVSARTAVSPLKSPTCVIRKFSQRKLALQDLVGYKTISSDMSQFMRLLVKLDLSAAVVGSTGSGKTVTLQAMLRETPHDKRIHLIQNPAEIDLTETDEYGVVIRDICSWEAKDLKGFLAEQSSSPTYAHLMDHSLRFSPQLFIFGELRSNEEFALAMKAANSGHYFFSTFHTEEASTVPSRFTGAVTAGSSGVSENLVMETVCNAIRFVVVQRRLPDGNRKVMEISEICGVDKSSGMVLPQINPIYRFIPDPTGRVGNENIKGIHAQVGTLSSRTREHLLLAGASAEDMLLLSREASPDKIIIGGYAA